jgi:hypothetical protein
LCLESRSGPEKDETYCFANRPSPARRSPAPAVSEEEYNWGLNYESNTRCQKWNGWNPKLYNKLETEASTPADVFLLIEWWNTVGVGFFRSSYSRTCPRTLGK